MVLLGSIDQGTSSSRFLVFDSETGDAIASHQVELRQVFPRAGWVEMDALEIVRSVEKCIEETCNNLKQDDSKGEIRAVGISNQRETTIVWDKETGEPLHNAIVWLDARTSQLAEQFTQKTPHKDREYFKQLTGLPIHPYFSALKLKWLLENVDRVREAADKGVLLFGTVDSWLIWRLCGGVHATDVTNASRTLLMDLRKLEWNNDLCEFFGIPMTILPEIRSSAEIYGKIQRGPLAGVPISGCLGDQQAALVGHNCLERGDAKNTYGTGTFMLCNIGDRPMISQHGLLSTVAFQFGRSSSACYAFEGSGSIGGNVVRFLRDNMQFVKIEELAATVETSDDVVFVPCFSGLYTPYWDASARGTICGLTQCTQRAHIARAALESVCFQTAEMLEAIELDLGDHQIHTLKIDGGMSKNQLFNQMQADILGKAIVCPKMAEFSSWGAAVAAGIACGAIDVDEYSQRRLPEAKRLQFRPSSHNEQERRRRLDRWKAAICRARGWAINNES